MVLIYILVPPYTNPNMISAMQKAGAIVTNIGGMTSHAAIVSRELHKPCIIGTKIATKLLKNGDKVAVDADSGTVKIINPKQKKTLNKFLTREAPLVAIEHWWAKGFKKPFEKFFCFSFPKIIFISQSFLRVM